MKFYLIIRVFSIELIINLSKPMFQPMKKVLLFLSCSALIFNLSAQVPTNGLVGAWTFNGNANDITANGNNGTVVNATLGPDRCGNSNSAYSFNGFGSYIVMLNAGPTGTVSRSLSYWSKSAYQNTSPIVAFDYGSSTGAEDAFQMVYNYNCIGVGLDVSTEAQIHGNSCLMDNRWHHIAAVYNASLNPTTNGVLFYIDGIPQPAITCFVTGTNAVINTGTPNPVTIGSQANGPGRFFDGMLDDFYLYDRPLSQSEVLQLYKVCLPAVAGNSVVCRTQSNTYSIAPVAGATSYSWSLPNGWTGTSSTNTISVVTGSLSGSVMVTANGTCNVLYSANRQVTVSACTDINETSAGSVSNHFAVFPNPSNGDIKVECNMNSTYTMVNCLGQVVLTGDLKNGVNSIDLTAYPKGIYLLTTSANSQKVIKIIKE
jgi:hypothetical protein